MGQPILERQDRAVEIGDERLLSTVRSLAGRSLSALTARAYETDVRQFLACSAPTDLAMAQRDHVARHEIE